MQSAAQYLENTQSAARMLFEGIDAYLAILRRHPTATFVTSYTSDKDWWSQHDAWATQNEQAIKASLDAQREYMGESFAQATLCGSVLQIAAKAIECHSKNSNVPSEWSSLINPGTKAVPFCVGRLVRGVPLGLVIYAGRNQHMHFEDKGLREPNIAVFDRLALNHGYSKDEKFRDPAFNLETEGITSFANNVTALIEWRSYDAYERDMRALLEI